MATDWRKDYRSVGVGLLEAQDMRGWERFLVSLLFVGATEDEIKAFAVELLSSASHDAQMFWNGRCECSDHLLN